DYQLRKRYLHRSRCELVVGGNTRFDGSEAEDHLATLLGYEYARSGASQARHRGIPGLLWIEQGQTPELGSVVAHAIEHIRSALTHDAAQATDTTDSVMTSVQEMRHALLTPSTGAPRGDYADALRAVDTVTIELEQLQSEAEKYRVSVDRLAALRREHARYSAERPWETLRR